MNYIDLDKARRARDKGRRDIQEPPQGADDDRPVIRLINGEIERVVDEAEAAIVASDRGLYQRTGCIVSVGEVKITTSGRSDSVAQTIVEREDYALVEDLTAAATFQRYDGRSGKWVTHDAPMNVAKTLKQRRTRLRLPVLTGIVHTPTIRPDGTVLDQIGYDQITGLLYDPRSTCFPPVPDKPTKADGKAALNMLEDLFSTMPFVSDPDRAVAVSAILTACSRNAYPTAPMHAVTAPTAGSGKSMIVDAATMVATGRPAAVMALGPKADETEKRLAGALLSGDPVLALDNCEAGVGGDLLCQILTQTSVRVRVLGASKVPDLPTNIFVTATGNNLRVMGDMTRRTVVCRINARIERPELRVFDTPDPVTVARQRRGELAVAAATVLRAYVVAGRPQQASPLGSFEGWSRTVRDAMLWLGSADPVQTMEEGRKSDPRLSQRMTVMMQWREVIGLRLVTAHDIIEAAIRKRGYPEPNEFEHPEFRDALLAIAGNGGNIDGKRLGTWIGNNKDSVVDGYVIGKGTLSRGIQRWHLCEEGNADWMPG